MRGWVRGTTDRASVSRMRSISAVIAACEASPSRDLVSSRSVVVMVKPPPSASRPGQSLGTVHILHKCSLCERKCTLGSQHRDSPASSSSPARAIAKDRTLHPTGLRVFAEVMKAQVGIIGAGPAGLVLAQLLAQQGVESVVLEDRSRTYVEARIRAGILEQSTVDVLTEAGVGDRVHREGLRHDGIHLQWPGHREHLDFSALCGRSVWAYGQTEVVKDLINARLAAGHPLHFEVSDVALHDVETNRPRITYTDRDGVAQTLECLVIAGCDGSHGPSRDLIPSTVRHTWERTYPLSLIHI